MVVVVSKGEDMYCENYQIIFQGQVTNEDVGQMVKFESLSPFTKPYVVFEQSACFDNANTAKLVMKELVRIFGKAYDVDFTLDIHDFDNMSNDMKEQLFKSEEYQTKLDFIHLYFRGMSSLDIPTTILPKVFKERKNFILWSDERRNLSMITSHHDSSRVVPYPTIYIIDYVRKSDDEKLSFKETDVKRILPTNHTIKYKDDDLARILAIHPKYQKRLSTMPPLFSFEVIE